MNINVNLDELITANFRDLTDDVLHGVYQRVVLQGGRASLKSTNNQYWIVLRTFLLRKSGIEIIKYQNKIGDRLVNPCRRAIKNLGLSDFFKVRKSPFEIVLLDKPNGKETDVSIKFVAPENEPDKLRSLEARNGGGFATILFEECMNYDKENDIETMIDTFARDIDSIVLIAYNPPMRSSHWLNKKYSRKIGKALGYDKDCSIEEYEYEFNGNKQVLKEIIHYSSYLSVLEEHPDWLGPALIGKIAKKKVDNNDYYRWNYLGEILPTEAKIFKNIKDWDGDLSKLSYKYLKMGLDCSNGGVDPWQYVNCTYDSVNEKLFILDEARVLAETDKLEDVKDAVLAINKFNQPVKIDGAVPLFGRLLRNIGMNNEKAMKGNGSVLAGIMWLRSLNGIYICKKRTPFCYKEFDGYEWVVDREDNVTSMLPDKDNHCIDAVRYAMNDDIRFN